ncbi:predicted protein [Nematostella vectensis]|uniref:Uncharacterized protein n=1 Tax=Nematostella vectensis TaxID=45351 RepID=A7T256_NEMVE|nr:predicted protein [Nematostella vectensis]|eukprot:XP_001622061.1 predicted protein [Nematostella vectensis]
MTVYPTVTMETRKATARRTRKSRFIFAARNGRIDTRQFCVTLTCKEYVTRDKEYVTRDKEYVTHDKEYVTRDKEYVTHDKEYVTHDKVYVTRDKEYVTNDKGKENERGMASKGGVVNMKEEEEKEKGVEALRGYQRKKGNTSRVEGGGWREGAASKGKVWDSTSEKDEELHKLRALTEEYKLKCEELDAKVSGLGEELEAKRLDAKDLEAKLCEHKQQVEFLQSHMSSVSGQMKGQEAQVTQYTQQLEQLKAALDQSKDNYDTQEPRPGPSGVSNKQFGLKSYVNFKTTFGRPSKATLVGKGKKRKVEEDPAKEVVISIGLKVWDEDELKEKKRKRLPLKVPQNATYALLLEKAKEKWQNFRNDLYDPESEYGLKIFLWEEKLISLEFKDRRPLPINNHMFLTFVSIVLDTQEPRPGPSGVSNEQFGLKSYVNFKTTFGRPSKATLVGKGKKRKVEEDPAKEVVISIGLKVWDENEEELKEKKRKRLPLKVPQNATYALLLEKAKEKWQNFRNDLYDPESEYGLVLEDNQHAQFIPGTGKKVFFPLNLYKEELVTDYKRVTIYLCKQVDIDLNEDKMAYGSSMEHPDYSSSSFENGNES